MGAAGCQPLNPYAAGARLWEAEEEVCSVWGVEGRRQGLEAVPCCRAWE